MSGTITRSDIVQLVLRVSLASVVTYYSLKWMMTQLDPTNKSKRKARSKAEQQIKRFVLSRSHIHTHFRHILARRRSIQQMLVFT